MTRRAPQGQSTEHMGDNMFNPRQQTPQWGMQAPSGGPAGGVQDPNGQPINGAPPQPQLPQIPIVAPPLQANQVTPRQPYNTNGYAQPNKVAGAGGGPLAGWDIDKWNDPSHQTPKYVSGRFMAEAGDQKNAANRDKYLDSMKEAYGAENFRFNGKDKISIDGGKSFVDVWGGAGAGLYTPAWQDESSQGGGPAGAGGLTTPAQMSAALQGPGATPAGTSAASFANDPANPFKSHPAGGVKLPNGDWVPGDHPAAAQASSAKPSGGGFPAPGGEAGPPTMVDKPGPGGMPNPNAPPAPKGSENPGGIENILKQFLSGDMNKEILNRRVDSARDVLNKQRSSAVDTLGASLADRGQLGSGAADSASVRLDQGLNDDFAMAVNDIYANEGENADKRLMEALGIGSEMEIADKNREVDKYNAETGRLNSDRNYDIGNKEIDVKRRSVANDETRTKNDFDLGNRRITSDENLGNRRMSIDEKLGSRGLDLTERGQNIDWDKFAAQFGLDSEALQDKIRSGDRDALIDILRIMGGNAGTAAGGFF